MTLDKGREGVQNPENRADVICTCPLGYMYMSPSDQLEERAEEGTQKESPVDSNEQINLKLPPAIMQVKVYCPHCDQMIYCQSSDAPSTMMEFIESKKCYETICPLCERVLQIPPAPFALKRGMRPCPNSSDGGEGGREETKGREPN